MKIEDYETAQALLNEKKELILLNVLFNKIEPFEFHSVDFRKTFHGHKLSRKSREELRRLINDFCVRKYKEIDEEISKL